ncbi:MAG: hypothetical protein LRY38_10415 [Aeromonadaceae bacterium]|nr:hypothetical protein [Aeromonadaceae bacterium]
MSISSVSSNLYSSLAQLFQRGSEPNSSVADETLKMPPPPKEKSGMLQDLQSTLADLGITSSDDSDSDDQLQSFMDTLMSTLQAQGAGGSPASSGTHPMKRDLQSLLNKLNSGDTDSDSGLSQLQSQFSSLLDSLGASDSDVSLTQFLQSFADQLPDGSVKTGSLLNLTA